LARLGIPRKQLALDQVAGGEVAAQEAALVQAQASVPRLEKLSGIADRSGQARRLPRD
jgi:hypothetical protein